MLHEPAAPVRGAVVHLHALGDEMNRSRRMVALQARELARSGFAVLLIDLLGCGDSSGESVDATWADWLDDVQVAADWSRARWSGALWLWGLRAGCLLAAEAAARRTDVELLLWQPPASGKSVLQNLLRLKLAGQLQVASGDKGAKRLTDELHQQLAMGQPLDVAGYMISAGLAHGLQRSTLDPGNGEGRRVVWLEVASRDDPSLLPPSETSLRRLQQQGWKTLSEAVQGPGFWQTTETEVAPQLLSATLRHMARVD